MKTKKLVLYIAGGIITIFIIASVIAAIVSQQKGEVNYTPENRSYSGEIEPQTETAANKVSADANNSEESTKKIIKTGSLEIVIKEIDEAVGKITDIVDQKQGFVSSSNIYTKKDKTKYGTMIVRVPAQYFEETIKEIKNLATSIKEESATSRDVTEEFVDLQARLKNLKLKEEQYQKILNRAVKIEDVLKASDYLFNTRKEIERLEGRIKYLENLTDLSTIGISLTEETKIEVPTSEWRPLTVFKNALRGMVELWQWIINTLIWIILLFGPLAILVWIIVKIVKKNKQKNKE